MVVVDRKVVENFGHMEAFVDHKEVVDCIDFVEADYPQAGAIVNQMMAKGASERGDVADAVKDNPALQRMMGRMTMLSLLKQGGADEESIKQLNRILQGIKK